MVSGTLSSYHLPLLVSVADVHFRMTSYKKMRKRLGLFSARQQDHSLESIRDHMIELRRDFPKAGAREMTSLLFHRKGMIVSRRAHSHIFSVNRLLTIIRDRNLVVVYFRVYERDLVRQRKAGRLKRRRFWSAGVNDMIAVDQHDKWQRFGLRLHTGIDPFPGVVHWMKVWWTNRNPKLILSYYLDVIDELGYMPLITQSDPGSENYGIANAHTALRHMHDPNLVGTIQHRWMREKKNVKPEIAWSQLRRRFTPGYEDLLEKGVTNGWYDTNRPLDVLVFRWLFIPFLQSELDAWVDRINNSKKRADKNKILPHGVPNDIAGDPARYGCLDFKIKVDPQAVQGIRQTLAPPDDPVFQLVPKEFENQAAVLYESMGSPPLSSKNIWQVYCELLRRFETLDEAMDLLEQCQVYFDLMEEEATIEQPVGVELLGGLDNIGEDGYYYMGGVNNGLGLGLCDAKISLQCH
ncbi:hypothetical protein CVT26_006839 [Gymnopilus dilepis]|uniref:Integrase core domain-containing protein n=1 Tax=Gymnopilus dilepis TaxID=231916 RepID=A0A409VMS9_9AGAR|nr:hypothetical protein CVT26_006839 [Gymnopilus dilepis]